MCQVHFFGSLFGFVAFISILKMMIYRGATPLDLACADEGIIVVLKAAGARCAAPFFLFPICMNLCRTLQVQS